MAFNTTPGSAEFTTKGALGVAGHYTEKRNYSKSDLIVFQERHYALMDNVLMQESRMIDVDDPEPKVFTMQESPVAFSLKSDDTDTTYEGDTIRMSDTLAVFLQAGDILEVPDLFCDSDGANYTTTKYAFDPETIIVDSVTLSGASSGVANILVTRGNGFSKAAAAAGTVTTILSEYKLVHMGNALADGGNAALPISHDVGDEQNYCQFYSRTWEQTTQEEKLNTYAKLTMGNKAAIKRQEFFRTGEIANFFGRRGKHMVSSNKVQLKEGGLLEFMPTATTSLDGETRRIDFGGAFDLGTLREKSEIIYRYGNSRGVKHWFCGAKFFTKLWNSLEKYIVVNDKFSQRYGWKVVELELGHGNALLHRHPLLTDQSTTNNDYASDCFVVDLDYIWMLNYIPVSLRSNIQDNDAHTKKDEIFRQKSLHRTHPSAHAVLYGITG